MSSARWVIAEWRNWCSVQPPAASRQPPAASRQPPAASRQPRPVVSGRVRTTGRNGQLDARVWDLNTKTRTQRLITRDVYRLADNQRGRFHFTLDGNGWRFAKGHRIVVELLGRDAPTYAPSPTPFSATLTGVRVAVPVRDRPSRKLAGRGFARTTALPPASAHGSVNPNSNMNLLARRQARSPRP